MTNSGPSSWPTYISRCDETGELINPELAVFNSRFAFAKGFRGLRVEGMASNTLHAYDAVAFVALAYTALESLERAIGSFRGSDSIVKHPIHLAEFKTHIQLGKYDKLATLIGNSSPSDYRRLKFEEKFGELQSLSEVNDLRPIVEGLRHSFFHGKFTVHGAGLEASKQAVELVQKLGFSVLDAADQQFDSWVQIFIK